MTRVKSLGGVLLALAVAALVLLPAATASHTPNPTAVTVAGSLQSEARLPGRLAAGLRGDAPHLRRGRRRLAGHVLAAGRRATSTRPR